MMIIVIHKIAICGQFCGQNPCLKVLIVIICQIKINKEANMPRVGKNIYKRKDGRWEGRYIRDYVDGKARYGAVYAHSYADVKVKLIEARQKATMNNNEFQKVLSEKTTNKKAITEKASVKKVVSPISCHDLDMTMKTAGEAWLTAACSTLKETSIRKYEDILTKYILPEFGHRNLNDITNTELIHFANSLLQEGGANQQGLSSGTVLEVMSVMNSIRIYELSHDRPVTYNVKCVNIKRENRKIRVFSIYEEKQLVDWLLNHMNTVNLGILLCLFTGLRVGEVCALKWENFNFGDDTFSIDKTMQRVRIDTNIDNTGYMNKKTEVKILPPKSEQSVRTIPIPQNLNSLLKENYKDEAYILTGSKNHYLEPRALQYRFKTILKQAGIVDANFHTTRHTFATRCVEQGVDIKCLSEILGHASVSVTLNRYVHPSMDSKRQNMARLSELFPLDHQ